MVGQGKILAAKTLQIQLLVTLAGGLIFLIANTAYASLSYLIGAGVSIIPNVVFAFFAFRFAGATKRDLVMKSFSQGSKIKLALTMILFVLAYQLPMLNPLHMLIGFAVTIATHALSIMWLSKRKTTISN